MIQRWELGKVVGMFKTRNGDWVKYADHEAIVKELVEALEEVRKIILPLPENALGGGRAHITHPDGECGEIEWSNREMVLDRINKAIAKAKEVS